MSPRRRALDRTFSAFAWLSAVFTVGAVLSVFVFVAREATPALRPSRGMPSPRVLIAPCTPSDGGPRAFTWQPVGRHPKFNVVPLVVGSVKVASLALLLAGPLGVAAACALAFLVGRTMRRWLKPFVELLAGVPSVVLGYLALTVLAGWIQSLTGSRYRLNALVAAVGVALAITPWIVTLTDEALRAVPREMLEGACALGASRAQMILGVAWPVARPAVMAALLLAFGRAVGETMIVLMASGNAPVLRLADPTSSARTLTATIAAELGEVADGSFHRAVLFLLGAMLFLVTLALNTAAERMVSRAARRVS
jgi:phosphate transport system permease protein